jgi:VRR-NUC domain
MTRRRQPEQELQRSVIAHLAWRTRPGVWWTHIPLGGLRSKIEASILRGLGTTRGCPDLLIVADGKAHFLELKAPRGRVSAEQHACHEALRAAGARVAVAYDIDDAVGRLEQWQLLRSNTSTQIGAFEELRRVSGKGEATAIRRHNEQ